ncbi:hypothetical protein FB192DRAFT_1251179, partial [Mucor lusitanicus]
VVSPPLTPAVSPLTPMLMDSVSDHFNHSNPHHQHEYNQAYAPYKETSHSTFTHHNGSSDSSVTSSTINSPLTHTQHKHVCHFHYCGWSFKRYEHLKRHMLVHTGERPYSCHFPGCGKSFSRSDNYHAHYRTHTKKKLSKKRGTKASSLSPISSPTPAATITPAVPAPAPASSAAANDAKSHICPVLQCQGRFKRLEHLKRHMRIHTLERPFSCSYAGCQKSFSRSDNLSQHAKTHVKSADKRR